MASFARTEGKTALVWIIEQRGRMIWTREGKAGSKGRLRTYEHATEPEARTAEAAMIAAKEAEGFALADAAAGVSAPLRASAAQAGAAPLRASAAHAAPPIHDDPEALRRRVVERLAIAPGASPPTVRAIVAAVTDAVSAPCTWRLACLALRGEAETVRVDVSFVQGKGSNPDDYEHDGFHVLAELAPSPAAELDEYEVVLDIFDGYRRLTPSALAQRFRRALDDLAEYAEIADQPTSAVTLARQGDDA
ncbi:hypothetical protein A7982_12637 [Minicystis rosea]|nr:hypothetical protein A7982_12637 [Minicystis rosea]